MPFWYFLWLFFKIAFKIDSLTKLLTISHTFLLVISAYSKYKKYIYFFLFFSYLQKVPVFFYCDHFVFILRLKMSVSEIFYLVCDNLLTSNNRSSIKIEITYLRKIAI